MLMCSKLGARILVACVEIRVGLIGPIEKSVDKLKGGTR